MVTFFLVGCFLNYSACSEKKKSANSSFFDKEKNYDDNNENGIKSENIYYENNENENKKEINELNKIDENEVETKKKKSNVFYIPFNLKDEFKNLEKYKKFEFEELKFMKIIAYKLVERCLNNGLELKSNLSNANFYCTDVRYIEKDYAAENYYGTTISLEDYENEIEYKDFLDVVEDVKRFIKSSKFLEAVNFFNYLLPQDLLKKITEEKIICEGIKIPCVKEDLIENFISNDVTKNGKYSFDYCGELIFSRKKSDNVKNSEHYYVLNSKIQDERYNIYSSVYDFFIHIIEKIDSLLECLEQNENKKYDEKEEYEKNIKLIKQIWDCGKNKERYFLFKSYLYKGGEVFDIFLKTFEEIKKLDQTFYKNPENKKYRLEIIKTVKEVMENFKKVVKPYVKILKNISENSEWREFIKEIVMNLEIDDNLNFDDCFFSKIIE